MTVGDASAAQPRWRADGGADLLLERTEELRVIHRQLRGLGRGESGSVLVTGVGGSGCTALLRRAMIDAGKQGIQVASAVGSLAESAAAYGIVHQLLVSANRPTDLLATRPDEPGSRPETYLVPSLCRLFLSSARDQPLLIVIDDLQWVDQPSMHWLAAMMRRPDDAPIVILSALNHSGLWQPQGTPGCCGEPPPRVGPVMALNPLSTAGVRTILKAAYNGQVDEEFVGAAALATRGNPGALRTTLRYCGRDHLAPSAENVGLLRARAAEAARDQVAQLLDALPPELTDLLRAIAVCGSALQFDLVCSLASLGTFAPSRAIELLSSSGLVVDEEGRPVIAGQATQELVLTGMELRDRQDLYARAAELGHRCSVSGEGVANMLLESRPIGAGWAADALRWEAERHQSAGELAVAARMLERALLEPLDEVQRAEVLLELGAVLLPTVPNAGQRRLRDLLVGPGGAETAPFRVRAADLLLIGGFAHDVRLSMAAASALLRATGSTDEIESLRALHWLAGVMDSAADEDLVDLPAAPTGSPIGPAQAGITAFALSVRGFDIERARRLARAALSSSGGAQRLISPRLRACEALLSADNADEAIRGLDGVLADARRWGTRPIGPILLTRARDLLHAGRLAAAGRDLAHVPPQDTWDGQHPILTPLFLALEGGVLLERGELAKAGQVLDVALPPNAEHGRAWGQFLLVRAQVRLAAGDAEAAYADAAECGRWLLAQQAGNPVLLPWRSVAALAKAACGDRVGAGRLAAAELDAARTWGAASGVGQALLTSGLLAGGTEAVRLLTEAVQTLRETPTRLRYGWALAELAAARVSAGEPASAASLSRLATEVAEECGSGRLSRRVAEIGKNSDIENDRTVVARTASLTRAEERVAVLASNGMSNRAIATELSVTLRAVELHLTKVYRKLHIRSRAALASTLGEAGRRPEHDAG